MLYEIIIKFLILSVYIIDFSIQTFPKLVGTLVWIFIKSYWELYVISSPKIYVLKSYNSKCQNNLCHWLRRCLFAYWFSTVLSGFIFKHLAFIFISISARLEELNSNTSRHWVEPVSAYWCSCISILMRVTPKCLSVSLNCLSLH